MADVDAQNRGGVECSALHSPNQTAELADRFRQQGMLRINSVLSLATCTDLSAVLDNHLAQAQVSKSAPFGAVGYRHSLGTLVAICSVWNGWLADVRMHLPATSWRVSRCSGGGTRS